jgi:hypothetical protein
MHHVAHLITAAAYLLLGGVLMGWVVRVWWTHPVNRAFGFGPYVTPEGVRLIIRNLPLVGVFGLFILACSADHAIDWLYQRGFVPYVIFETAAIFEAIVSAGTALAVVWLSIRRRAR